MAGVAIVGFDGSFAIGGRVLAIMAAEAARPIFVANVVWINLPTSLHLREEVVEVNLLNGINVGSGVWIFIGQGGGNGFESLGLDTPRTRDSTQCKAGSAMAFGAS